MTVHLIKMCVGVEDVAHLAELQAGRLRQERRRGEPAVLRHYTRQTPRRAAELVDGGSLFWVIRGFVRVRQNILDVERCLDADGRPRCALALSPDLFGVRRRAFKPFQGWRYLRAEDAPPDNGPASEGFDGVPPELAAELRELGLL